MIRLAAVIDTFDVGGFELACLELMKRLDRTRFDRRIYAFRPGALVGRARDAGIEVVVGHEKPSTDTAWRPEDSAAREAWARRLVDLMTTDRVDLCFIWGWPDAVAAAADANVRAIVERVDGPSLATRIVDKSVCNRVVVESVNARDVLVAQRERLKLNADAVVVIPNGTDLSVFDPDHHDRAQARRRLDLAPDAFVVGALARLSPEKNLGQLVRAFEQAGQLDDGFAANGRLVLAGPDGGSRAELEQLARDLGVRDRVRFLGSVDDRPGLLAALDAYGSTSITEGTPNSIVEAIAMGLPIIATPVGGVTDMVDGNAILVDLLSPRATARAMVDLMRDAGLRRRLAERSRALAPGWDIHSRVAAYERVLDDAWREARA